MNRNCPECNREIYYCTKYVLESAILNNTKCRSCGKKGKLHPMFGKSFSNEHRKKLSDAHKGKKCSTESKEKIRLKAIGRKVSEETRRKMSVAKTGKVSWKKGLKGFVFSEETKRKLRNFAANQPRRFGRAVDKGQVELINKWNTLGFNFEINYKLHTDEVLYFLDGYDKERNIVMEYDGKNHLLSKQKEKDLIRQNKIIDILKPKKFFRYDAVNKQIKNVLEGMG